MEKVEISALIGDYDWKYIRVVLLQELINCENEIDFLEFIEHIVNSTGSKEELEQKRKKLKIKPFNDKDKKLMRKLER